MSMQMGMVGLGRMGASMVRRLMRGGHECVAYDVSADAVASVAHEGARGVSSLDARVHNGIEYGMMAAYAEGLNILRHANVGSQARVSDGRNDAVEKSEVVPVRPEPSRHHRGLASRQCHRILAPGPHRNCAGWRSALSQFAGRASDSGEGRWTITAAIDEGVPAPVLTAARYERFSSRGEADFADRLLSAMRYQFGGHHDRGSTTGSAPKRETS
jgi:6-phosphogluconate dehydrogenase